MAHKAIFNNTQKVRIMDKIQVQEDDYGNPLPGFEVMFSKIKAKVPTLEHDDGYGNDLPE